MWCPEPVRRQVPVRWSWPLLLLAVLPYGCTGDHFSDDLLDSGTTGLRVCGFPESQLDISQVGPPSYLTSIGRVRLGQSLPLQLKGDMTGVDTVSWRVEPQYGRTGTHLAFASTGGSSATLVGLRLSADDNDYDFAFARVVFHDGSEVNAVVSVCTGSGWRPADHIVVVP